MDDDLLAEVKSVAPRTNRTLSSVIEDAVRELLACRDAPRRTVPIQLPTFRGNGLRPGIDLDDPRIFNPPSAAAIALDFAEQSRRCSWVKAPAAGPRPATLGWSARPKGRAPHAEAVRILLGWRSLWPW